MTLKGFDNAVFDAEIHFRAAIRQSARIFVHAGNAGTRGIIGCIIGAVADDHNLVGRRPEIVPPETA